MNRTTMANSLRQFKFRAWNKTMLKMATWEEILKHCNRMSFLKEDGWIFMQFIGRLDKNGVEIYEGDICRNRYYERSHGYYYQTKIVVWDNRSACWLGWNFCQDEMMCEVIGNIHVHPELLEDLKK